MSFDGDAHEARRNVMLGVGLSVLAVVLVGGMFWVMSSLSRPVITGTATAATTTTTTDPRSAAPAPTTTTAAAPPKVGTWTNTVTLPPGEQPTMTAPVAGQTVDPPPAPATSAPPPPPKTTQAAPPPPTTPPAPPAAPAPSVTKVNLSCKKDSGKKTTATLTFTTTTRVDVVLAPGGVAQRGQAGPGDVSLSASSRGADLCYAQIAGQMVGPVPAT
jgi:outer membrane biosynthesis protein TonB